MPDIAKINNVAVADISKLDSITFAHGQKVNNQDVSLVTDAHTLIATATASSSATLSFTTGIDSTYDAYEFRFMNMHPASSGVTLGFQVNADGLTGFNETITSSAFRAYHRETGEETRLEYYASSDQAQGTAYQQITSGIGIENDESCSGILTLYAPSSTTYVKHFTSRLNGYNDSDYSVEVHIGGYINTTSAIDEISFKMSSGNIDAGVINLYGIATS